VIDHDRILFLFIYDPHRDRFRHPLDDDSSDIEVNCENACIDPEQPLVCIQIYGTPHLENSLARKCIGNKYFDIFQDESDVWPPLYGEEDYRLGHQCIMPNFRRAAMN
jgi:hypothetical protein